MIMGAVLAMARNVPAKLKVFFERKFIVTVDIAGNDQLFKWVTEWLAAQPTFMRTQLLTATVGNDDNRPYTSGELAKRKRMNNNERYPVVLSPAPGIHFFRYKGKFILVYRERKESGEASHWFYKDLKDTLLKLP